MPSDNKKIEAITLSQPFLAKTIEDVETLAIDLPHVGMVQQRLEDAINSLKQVAMLIAIEKTKIEPPYEL